MTENDQKYVMFIGIVLFHHRTYFWHECAPYCSQTLKKLKKKIKQAKIFLDFYDIGPYCVLINNVVR